MTPVLSVVYRCMNGITLNSHNSTILAILVVLAMAVGSTQSSAIKTLHSQWSLGVVVATIAISATGIRSSI